MPPEPGRGCRLADRHDRDRQRSAVARRTGNRRVAARVPALGRTLLRHRGGRHPARRRRPAPSPSPSSSDPTPDPGVGVGREAARHRLPQRQHRDVPVPVGMQHDAGGDDEGHVAMWSADGDTASLDAYTEDTAAARRSDLRGVAVQERAYQGTGAAARPPSPTGPSVVTEPRSSRRSTRGSTPIRSTRTWSRSWWWDTRSWRSTSRPSPVLRQPAGPRRHGFAHRVRSGRAHRMTRRPRFWCGSR